MHLNILLFCQEVCVTWVIFSCFAAGIVLEDKKWPPFFPQIIQNDIPVHLARLAYVAFSTLLVFSSHNCYIQGQSCYLDAWFSKHGALYKLFNLKFCRIQLPTEVEFLILFFGCKTSILLKEVDKINGGHICLKFLLGAALIIVSSVSLSIIYCIQSNLYTYHNVQEYCLCVPFHLLQLIAK
ncbi:uncharacterized protein LOC131302527 [Rhododendron vialii]|uniref:uncharacterized protein LOC131302527 n=1 Tax=Rhododendron vialii TaxID=182163 RepID=UPI00265F887C|nr:uncharacterized protein LOC131302527 [Rhododendron vialii]